jgi:hypothetical protein
MTNIKEALGSLVVGAGCGAFKYQMMLISYLLAVCGNDMIIPFFDPLLTELLRHCRDNAYKIP